MRIMSKINPTENEYLELINKFKLVCEELGRPLGVADLIKNRWSLPTSKWYIKYCPDKNVNNYNDFLNFLGFTNRYNKTKEFVVNFILNTYKKLNRPLIIDDFININDDNSASISLIKKYWGTFNNMKKELGLEITQENMLDKQKSKEEMIDNIKEFINEFGRIPTYYEIDNNSNFASRSTYNKFFGGYNNVFLMLGYLPKKKCISLNLTNEEIIQIYKDFIDDLGNVPTYDYCRKVYELPAPRTIIRRFNCTWNEFIKMIGYEPNNKNKRGQICIAKDGTKCLSIAECLIHNYFLDNNFNIIAKEYYYKNLIEDRILKNFIGYKRFDWLLQYNNKFYIIEYFGFMGNYDYDKRHDLKLEFIKKANLQDNFIAVYLKDLNRLDEIFSFLK